MVESWSWPQNVRTSSRLLLVEFSRLQLLAPHCCFTCWCSRLLFCPPKACVCSHTRVSGVLGLWTPAGSYCYCCFRLSHLSILCALAGVLQCSWFHAAVCPSVPAMEGAGSHYELFPASCSSSWSGFNIFLYCILNWHIKVLILWVKCDSLIHICTV